MEEITNIMGAAVRMYVQVTPEESSPAGNVRVRHQSVPFNNSLFETHILWC